MSGKEWKPRQVAYLKKHYATMSAAEIASEVHHPVSSVYQKAKKMGLEKHPDFLRIRGSINAQHPKSVAARFTKGHVPSNKGKRIEEFMSAEAIRNSSHTRFKPGQLPHNTKPIGYERIDGEGYVWIKTEQCMTPKHRWVWEQHYGPIPYGHNVAFRDGNRQNCDLSNLYLISREDAARQQVSNETPEHRTARVVKAQATRNKSIRRDKIRIHWGLEPLGNLVKKW